jgi:nucleoside-diphosphate-sugar epimerase
MAQLWGQQVLVTGGAGFVVRSVVRALRQAELLTGVLARGFRVLEQPMTMRARTAGRSKKGNSLVYGWSYARVVLGTWRRERAGRARPVNAALPSARESQPSATATVDR